MVPQESSHSTKIVLYFTSDFNQNWNLQTNLLSKFLLYWILKKSVQRFRGWCYVINRWRNGQTRRPHKALFLTLQCTPIHCTTYNVPPTEESYLANAGIVSFMLITFLQKRSAMFQLHLLHFPKINFNIILLLSNDVIGIKINIVNIPSQDSRDMLVKYSALFYCLLMRISTQCC
jgi:hypothetical protein